MLPKQRLLALSAAIFIVSAFLSSAITALAEPVVFVNHLAIGSRGIEVRNLQQVLTTQGVYTGPITGYFGPLTQAGVERFQTKYGIDPVGEVGPITRAKLNSFASGLFSAENQGLQDQINNLQSKLDALTAASAASTSVLQNLQNKISDLQNQVNAFASANGVQASGLGVSSFQGTSQTPQLQSIQDQINAIQNIENQLGADSNISFQGAQTQINSLQQIQDQTNSSLLQDSTNALQSSLTQSLLDIQNQITANPNMSLQQLQNQINSLQQIQSQLNASYLNSTSITTQP